MERLAFIELLPDVLARALEPFPTPVRKLDALFSHRSSFCVALASPSSYDGQLTAAARAPGIPIARL